MSKTSVTQLVKLFGMAKPKTNTSRSFRTILAIIAILTLVVSACTPAATPSQTTAPKETKPQAEAPKPKAEEPKPKTEAPKTEAPKAEAKAPAKVEPINPPVTVKVGDMGIVAESGLYMAQDRGYFKELGINLETIPFDTGPRVIPALAAGQIDVGFGSIGAGFYNAVARDVNMKIVIGASQRAPGIKDTVVAIRKDLVDSGKFKDYPDIKGKTVALAAMDGGSAPQLDKTLIAGGLSIADVNVVIMPYPDMLAAFANKSLDAAVLIEPHTTNAIEKNLAVSWKITGDYYPGHQAAAYFYSSQFAANKPEVAKRFALAILKGQRDYDAAFFKNKDRDSAVSIIAKATKTEPAVLNKIAASKIGTDGHPNIEAITFDQDWYAKQGFIPQKADIGKLIDNQFIDYAIGILGKYE